MMATLEPFSSRAEEEGAGDLGISREISSLLLIYLNMRE
jgi:hypothetical protein